MTRSPHCSRRLRKRLLQLLLGLIVSTGFFVPLLLTFSPYSLRNTEPHLHTRKFNQTKQQNSTNLLHAVNHQLQRKARENLIIVSHGRSGSTLTGDIFNHHPSVFYMYEPLQTVRRTQKKFRNKKYNSLAGDFLTNIFRCRFDEPRFLKDINVYYRKPVHPRVSRAIASPPLCPYNMTDSRWNPTLCPPMTSESLGNTCKNTYDLTVIKVLMSRIPDNSIEKLVTACNPVEIHCKIIYLIRDPRAVIPSSFSVGFYRDADRQGKLGTRMFSYNRCKQTEKNLEFVRKLPPRLRSRFTLLRYEDLAMNPLKELERLYKFAGLSVVESVRTWLNETTHKKREDCDPRVDGGVVCTKDDAWSAVNRWRWKVHPYDIGIIEHYCGHVMRLMGYKPVDRSYELLTNVTIPLFSKNYEAKAWGG